MFIFSPNLFLICLWSNHLNSSFQMMTLKSSSRKKTWSRNFKWQNLSFGKNSKVWTNFRISNKHCNYFSKMPLHFFLHLVGHCRLDSSPLQFWWKLCRRPVQRGLFSFPNLSNCCNASGVQSKQITRLGLSNMMDHIILA